MSDKLVNIEVLNDLAKKLDKRNNDNITLINEKIAEIRDEMVILEEDDLSMEGIIDNTFPNLTTTDKTLIGAINELNNKLEKAPSGGDVPSEGIETEIEKAVIDEMLMDIFGITVEEGE